MALIVLAFSVTLFDTSHHAASPLMLLGFSPLALGRSSLGLIGMVQPFAITVMAQVDALDMMTGTTKFAA